MNELLADQYLLTYHYLITTLILCDSKEAFEMTLLQNYLYDQNVPINLGQAYKNKDPINRKWLALSTAAKVPYTKDSQDMMINNTILQTIAENIYDDPGNIRLVENIKQCSIHYKNLKQLKEAIAKKEEI